MSLAPCTRALVGLSAAVASRSSEALDAAMERAAQACRPRAVEEALLQSYLFVGYPLALEALGRWRSRSGAEPGPAAADRPAWVGRGARVCAAVYGGQYEALRANIRALHPDVETWMVEEGYGKVLGRPGLELPVRELCVVGLLAVWGAPRQLYSHLRGALNVGASAADVDAALEEALLVGDAGRRAEAREVWASVKARTETSEAL